MKLGLALASVVLASLGCAAPQEEGSVSGDEADLTVTPAALAAAGFTKVGAFDQTCQKKYPLPTGCDLWASKVRVTRYEHADGRVLHTTDDLVFTIVQRGSTLHTVSVLDDHSDARFGRRALVTVKDVVWTKGGEPSLVVDVDTALRDLWGKAPTEVDGRPVTVSGDVVHIDGLRADRRGLGWASSRALSLSLQSVPGAPSLAPLRPQLSSLNLGDSYVNESIHRGPDGDLPTWRAVPTPTPANRWAVVSEPFVATGPLQIASWANGYPAGCYGATALEVSAPKVVACTKGTAACSSSGKRWSTHLAMANVDLDLEETDEAPSQKKSIVLDGARVMKGTTPGGQSVALTLMPGGNVWQVRIAERTYGFPLMGPWSGQTMRCLAHR